MRLLLAVVKVAAGAAAFVVAIGLDTEADHQERTALDRHLDTVWHALEPT